MKINLALMLVTLGFTLASANRALASDGTGLNLVGAADIVGQLGFEPNNGASNQLNVREAEVMLYAPIDHLFDGRLSFAAHQESGTAFFEMHEVFVGSTKLIPRSRFRIGQFFLGVGRLNQFHRHDWPFISPPKVFREFFNTTQKPFAGGEGLLDSGAEYSFLFPTPFYLDMTVGITNGWNFGHSHTVGTQPAMPTHYLRLETFTQHPASGGTQWGLNYIGRKSQEGLSLDLYGLDWTSKWKEAKLTSFLLQAELWYRVQRPRDADSERTLGFYIFPEFNLGANTFLGIRGDYYSVRSRTDDDGNYFPNHEFAFVPTLTYRASEFSTFRFAYSWIESKEAGVTQKSNHVAEVQAVIIMGAHPAHDF